MWGDQIFLGSERGGPVFTNAKRGTRKIGDRLSQTDGPLPVKNDSSLRVNGYIAMFIHESSHHSMSSVMDARRISSDPTLDSWSHGPLGGIPNNQIR